MVFKVLVTGWLIGTDKEVRGKKGDLGAIKVLEGRHDFSSKAKEVTTTIEH